MSRFIGSRQRSSESVRHRVAALAVALVAAGVGVSTPVLKLPPVAAPAEAASLPSPYVGTVESFYVVPDPLPPGPRGRIIRMQAIDAGSDRTGWRIMYHSVDESGADRAVTGIITIPVAAPPTGGWPVIAHAHGTTGVNERCAPSRGPALPGWSGVEGVRVQTDYIGLGPVGEMHPYLQRAAESNAVIDSVRAAHEIVGSDLSRDWYLIGGSQGGHAALAAYEDAVTQLAGLRLRGTVALVPGAETTRTFGDRVQLQIIMAFAVFGNRDEYPDLNPESLLTPEAYAALVGPMTTQCVGEGIAAALPFALADTLFREDPETNPAVIAYRERNEVGRRRGASPIFVAGGVKDITVVIARVRALRDSLCSIGQPLTYLEAPEGDHGTTGALVALQLVEWMAARSAGEPLTSDCPTVPTTSTTVPNPVPPTSPSGSTSVPSANPSTSSSTTTSTTGDLTGTPSSVPGSTTSTVAGGVGGVGGATVGRPAPATPVSARASYTG